VATRGRGTRAVHGAREPKPGPLTTPVVQTSTFAFASSDEMRRYLDGGEGLYLYTRYENPTLQTLQSALAELEGGEAGLVFASGMAAMTTAILSVVEPGDEVVASSALYGGTTRFVREILPRWGMSGRFVAPSQLADIGRHAGPKARAVVLESPTNPILEIVDIAAVAAAAHDRGLVVIVDNTFATPMLQRPLELGADIVMHSLTKALSGHSDLIGGALVASKARIEKAHALIKVLGGCMDPHPASLVLRGLKTVHLRVERMCANAAALADRLAGHPKLSRVIYPGRPEHPGHEIARRQMSGAFGGLLTIALEGGLPAAELFYDRLRLVARAASLGGVESLASLPLHTSHHGFTPEQLQAAGIDPGMVRLSMGVEDAADLVEDVEQALAAV
jgi:cystathionine beta-lyase/cystathionine gamma-synthase